MKFEYFFAKLIGKFLGNQYKYVNKYFKKSGVIFSGGGGTAPIICCDITENEPYLITIGDDTVISGNVKFITHDHSVSRINRQYNDVFGEIKIGRNCFIGQNAILLYGVTICDNVIVAAGAVVTKSINEPFTIYGGNPAKKISEFGSCEEKIKNFAWSDKICSRKELERKQKNGEFLMRK